MDEAAIRQRLDSALAEHMWEFGKFFLLRFFGLDVTYGDETCVVEIPTVEYMFNPQGSLHGGVMVLALDVSMGHLCERFLSRAVTLSMTIQFLRPVLGPARCEARFVKKGRRVVNMESRMWDDDGKLVALATGLWQRLPETPHGSSG